MDIATIAARTGVPPRRLRYVLEHVMLPGISRTGEGPGVTRDFVASQAFAVALTALLFEAGLGQKSVKRCVDRFSARHTDKWGNAHQALFKRLFRDETISHLEIADAKNTRVIYRKENGKGFSVARWIQIGTGAKLDRGYQPLVILRLAVAVLRDRLKLQDA